MTDKAVPPRRAAAKPSTPPARTSTIEARPLAQVLRSAANCACGGGCPRCQTPALQRQATSETEGALDTATAVRTAQRGGQALPEALRAYFEPRFGQDFSQVRVHTDGQAAQAARGVQAKAYTTGRSIVFGEGQYAPGTTEGKRLLAHELTHVVQQSGQGATPAAVSRDFYDTAMAELQAEEEIKNKQWNRAYGRDPSKQYGSERGSIDEDVTFIDQNKQKKTRHQPRLGAASGAVSPQGKQGTKMDMSIALSDADVEAVMMDSGYGTKDQNEIKQAAVGAGASITEAFRLMQIDTLEAQALYLAHAAVESRGLRSMTAQADPAVVGKFPGRGPLQVTFQQQYVKALAYLDEQVARLESQGLKDEAAKARAASSAVKADPAAAADPRYAFIFSAAAMHASGGVQASSEMVDKTANFGGTGPEDRWETGGDNFNAKIAHWTNEKAKGNAAATERLAFWGGVKAAGQRKANAYNRALATLQKNVLKDAPAAAPETAPLQRQAIDLSTPGDAAEREADATADRVLRMADPAPSGQQPGASPQGAGTSAPMIQREPTTTPATTPAAPATDNKAAPKPDPDKDAKLKEAAKKVEDHPLIVGLISDMYQDLRYRRDFSADERFKLKLKGTESASYSALFSAAVLPSGGAGGLQYGDSFGSNLSVFGKYLDAIEPLTPSNSLKTDLVSRMLGMRIDEYLGSPTFIKRLSDNAQTVIFLAMVAQIGILTKDRASPATADEGGLVDETWNADLMLAKTMIGLIFKEKLKAPGIFDVGPLLTPTHPAYAKDNYFGGNLLSGLNVDAASSPNGGNLLHLGGTLNLAKLAGAGGDKLGAADLDDPRKYRGWQGSVWGDYQHLLPTPELSAQGREPDRRFRAGALFGSQGMFILADVGGHYSGPEAKQLTSMFFTEGLAYAPGEGPLKKVGFKITQMNWKAGDSLAPTDASGAGTAGAATRVQPFGAFDINLGGGSSLAFGGSAGITSVTGQPINLSDWRGDISYTYLGTGGTADKPAFRIELSGSGSQVDYFNKASPTLYGMRAKMQIDSTFYGLQVNTGADKIDPARAAQMPDPHGGEGPNAVPGGNSVLVVVGVLQ